MQYQGMRGNRAAPNRAAMRVLLSPLFWGALWLVGVYFAFQYFPFSGIDAHKTTPNNELASELWPTPEIMAGFPSDGVDGAASVGEGKELSTWRKLPGYWTRAFRRPGFKWWQTAAENRESARTFGDGFGSVRTGAGGEQRATGAAPPVHGSANANDSEGSGADSEHWVDVGATKPSSKEHQDGPAEQSSTTGASESAGQSQQEEHIVPQQPDTSADQVMTDASEHKSEEPQASDPKGDPLTESGGGTSGAQDRGGGEGSQAQEEDAGSVVQDSPLHEVVESEEAAKEQRPGPDPDTDPSFKRAQAEPVPVFDPEAVSETIELFQKAKEAEENKPATVEQKGEDGGVEGDGQGEGEGAHEVMVDVDDKGSDPEPLDWKSDTVAEEVPFDFKEVNEIMERFEADETLQALVADKKVIDGTTHSKRRAIFDFMDHQAQRDRARQQLEMDLDVGLGDVGDDTAVSQLRETLIETVPLSLFDDDDDDIRPVDVSAQHMYHEEHAPKCRKLAWFMVGSASALPFDILMMKVALLSALRNAPSLLPHILWDGPPCNTTDWMQRNGARVIFYSEKLTAEIRQALVNKARATPLTQRPRAMVPYFDIPFMLPGIMESHRSDASIEATSFLFTHSDVMFLQDVSTCTFKRPSLIAVAGDQLLAEGLPVMCVQPQTSPVMRCSSNLRDQVPRPPFATLPDTGVMFVHATGLADAFSELLLRGSDREWHWAKNDYFEEGNQDDYYDDKGLGLLTLMTGFKKKDVKIPVLSDNSVWKGYKGANSKAVVVHLQGVMRCVPCYLGHATDWREKCGCSNVDRFWAAANATDGGAFFLELLRQFKSYTAQLYLT